jgi:hypothetical protein
LPSKQFLYLIQEPYLYQGNVCGLEQFRLYYTGDVSARPAIFTNLPATFHANLSGRDCTTCSIKMGGLKVFFLSVYLDINTTVEEPNWMKTIQKTRANNANHYAAVDSNLHSTLWECQIANPRGLEMEDLIYGTGLSLINTGNKPTFETRRASPIIDLTLTSPALATHVRQWHVEDKMHLSDHNQISCVVRLWPEPLPVCKGRNL